MTAPRKNGKVNMKTLATELNLSTATVSKALRDSYDISAETKLRVIEAAKRLNYIPNPFASSLRNHRSNTVAIILPEIADSFFSQAINGIESVVNQYNYHALIYLTHESYLREVHMFTDLNSGRVDGVLMSVACGTKDTTHIQSLMDAGLPIVLFDRICENILSPRVTTDDYASAYRATCHLLDQGCKNISLITIEGFSSILSARESGYRQALTDHSLLPENSTVLTCPSKYTAENGLIIKDHLLKARPDGMVVTVEHLATSAYIACKDLKLNIPDDIKVIGFTNQLNASILYPSLSTIQQPAYEMGKRAAELLFRALSGKQTEMEEIVIPSELMIRDSTRTNKTEK